MRRASAGAVWSAGLRDVQAAVVFDVRDDSGVDGGQVDRPAGGAAGRRVLAGTHVAALVVRLDGPVLAGETGVHADPGLTSERSGT